jgi:hypothetical protein
MSEAENTKNIIKFVGAKLTDLWDTPIFGQPPPKKELSEMGIIERTASALMTKDEAVAKFYIKFRIGKLNLKQLPAAVGITLPPNVRLPLM